MGYADVEKYLGPTLAEHGFTRYAVEPDITWHGAPAWAVYYRSQDCKLQVCAADREGGTAILLTALSTPDRFGFDVNGPRWYSLRWLDKTADNLGDPPPYGSGEDAQWNWDKKLLEAHLGAASAVLAGQASV
jgi:hypothetical protein